jgi:bifunctional ADP-heptose synthase (sugar kinase/adenylyltransferase)
MSFEERIELARSIKYVDLVVAQDTYSPLKNILDIEPDILMESTSHAPESEVIDAMKELGGRIIRIPYFPEHSSTQIKKEIING